MIEMLRHASPDIPIIGEMSGGDLDAGITVKPGATGHERIALDPQVSGKRTLDTWNEVFQRLTSTFKEVQPLSAIALELAHVAAGDYDGFVQIGGSPVQDFAAGALLIREAGGVITTIDSSDKVRRVVRERLGIAADEIDGGHCVALSRPKELAERLDAYQRVAQRRSAQGATSPSQISEPSCGCFADK
jgi:hypothetical protein